MCLSRSRFSIVLLVFALPASPAFALDHGGSHDAHAASGGRVTATARARIWKAVLARPPLATAATFDARGRLWRTLINNGYLHVQFSDDRGGTFSEPVRVNREPEHIAADGESRPNIAVTGTGHVYVLYTQSLDVPMTGHVRFSYSLDDGKSFAAPVTVNDNHEAISHRFGALAVDGGGRIHIAWLDKRDQAAARRRGESYRGAALYYAVSDASGAFTANQKIADHTCECCRVALALDTDRTPVIVWRHIFGRNIRDHALVRLDNAKQPVRVSRDHWAVDACPHHGPAIAIGRDGVYHIAWFTNAAAKPGLFYSRSDDRGKTFSAPTHFGSDQRQAGHPALLSLGRRVYLGWKEFDGKVTSIYVMVSNSAGASWSTPRRLATTADASDHPQLISNGSMAYLSWYTLREGYRLIPLSTGSTAE